LTIGKVRSNGLVGARPCRIRNLNPHTRWSAAPHPAAEPPLFERKYCRTPRGHLQASGFISADVLLRFRKGRQFRMTHRPRRFGLILSHRKLPGRG
jgi:hypothetical protein